MRRNHEIKLVSKFIEKRSCGNHRVMLFIQLTQSTLWSGEVFAKARDKEGFPQKSSITFGEVWHFAALDLERVTLHHLGWFMSSRGSVQWETRVIHQSRSHCQLRIYVQQCGKPEYQPSRISPDIRSPKKPSPGLLLYLQSSGDPISKRPSCAMVRS